VTDSGARSVAARGTIRSTPSWIQTTQERPRYCLFVMSIRGSVRPYKGCRGSTTVTVSLGKKSVSMGVVSWLCFAHLGYRQSMGSVYPSGFRSMPSTDSRLWFPKPKVTEVLDFYHASEYIWDAGHAVWAQGTQEAKLWGEEQCHTLKHDGPGRILGALRTLDPAA
jgi:hypothetical protein